MAEILPGRVEMLRAFEEKAVNLLLSNGLNIDGRIINNAKVSDHHAIIPTENIRNAVNMELTSDEKQILHLVIRRVLEALSAQYEYMDIEYVFDICGETFKLKQKKPVNLGWKALCPDDVEIPPEINCSENDTFYAEDIFVTEGETKPPKRYTESSLLKAMENIDRRIEDKELSGYVSERGLGTPATRAAIIEKILADGYAERKNKVISATEMGIKMINFVPPEIKSVEMTAAMELQLAAIENGTASADEVISSITEKIKAIIEAEKHRAHTPVAEPRTAQKNPVGKCPKCGGNVYKFVRDNTGIFYCEKAPKDCIFCVYEDDYFFTSKGKKLTESMMKNLLSQGEVKVSGFKSEKTGNTYNAVVSFADRTDKNGNAKIGFTMRFEDKKKR
jgi:DNA topoisomerase